MGIFPNQLIITKAICYVSSAASTDVGGEKDEEGGGEIAGSSSRNDNTYIVYVAP